MSEPNIDEIRKKMEDDDLVLYRTSIDYRTDPSTQTTLAKFQLIYSVVALVLGLACVIGGVVLFLNGVAGATSWTASILGAESKISDAAPGAVLFVVGLFIVFVTRYRFEHK